MKPSIPFFINDRAYYLRFEIADMVTLEDNFGILMALFDPQKFGYSTAAKFIMVSLYDKNGEDFVHHFPQHQKSLEPSIELVREFCGQFKGPSAGLAFIYSSIYTALVASGWFKDVSEETEKVADIKNSKPVKSPRSSSKTTKTKRSESAGSPTTNSSE
jgi:hypothetical protein